MTHALEKAFARARELPEENQDFIAHMLLEIIEDEAWWDAQFAASEDLLIEMADLAHEEFLAGRTEVFDPDTDVAKPDEV
jgi:hypothetical protein